ncbi:reactive oxygen species modulator 1-like [Sycon ciliatum]|uniref:reactive oxygen species modulator 1-like n=1 Tax=Sycon ciliatum TaxID=27933 RepID=UPI0031F68C48
MPHQPQMQVQKQSCFQVIKFGFMMGFSVGCAAGTLLGTYAAVKMGLRGRELMAGVGKSALQSGGTFGVFMGIGTAIRGCG